MKAMKKKWGWGWGRGDMDRKGLCEKAGHRTRYNKSKLQLCHFEKITIFQVLFLARLSVDDTISQLMISN